MTFCNTVCMQLRVGQDPDPESEVTNSPRSCTPMSCGTSTESSEVLTLSGDSQRHALPQHAEDPKPSDSVASEEALDIVEDLPSRAFAKRQTTVQD